MDKKEKNLLVKCKVCGKEVAKGVKKCPNCGKDQRNFFMKHKVLSFVIAVFILGGIGGAMGDDSTADDKPVAKIESDESSNEKTAKNEEGAKSAEEKIPTEYKSALKQAKSYSKTMHMSKAAIYDQLVSEHGGQFKEEAAQYAIDNIEADWKENALESAKSYQETMAMSQNAIYDQLVSEHGGQFTAEEAKYAVDNLE